MKAIRLKTEYLTNPIGIDYTKPRLSWVCEGGKTQTAYQIIAKDDNGNVVWDSEKTNSSKMHLIPWGGEDLKSRQRINWSVELWDEEGNKGEPSEEATFELGLIDESDWKATWITGNYSVKRK
ncbi:MAG: alfa-L-rhamnosidase, partial [Butyrivibrio sp.]|nr:alfa-L-rhamnosidase [Butyrivibrio sp.]